MSKSYNDLAAELPFVKFIELQAQVTHVDCKKWIREIAGVSVKKLTEQGRVLSIKYVPHDHGQYKDSGEISTAWLPDPVAQMIGEAAKANVGKKMLFFQLNRGHSEDQPSGFREIVWLEELEPRPNENRADTRQESTGPSSVQSSPPVEQHNEAFSPTVAEHLNVPEPEYHDESPF